MVAVAITNEWSAKIHLNEYIHQKNNQGAQEFEYQSSKRPHPRAVDDWGHHGTPHQT